MNDHLSTQTCVRDALISLGEKTRKSEASNDLSSMADPEVIARAMISTEPILLSDYIRAHNLEKGLNYVLNVLARNPSTDPWKLLVESLPNDIPVPSISTVPNAAVARELLPEWISLREQFLLRRG